MTLSRIRLELARTKDHPEGDPNHGYEFVAPLDAQGHLDAAGWKANREVCTVRSFVPGEDEEVGHLVHSGKAWMFDYKSNAEDDDEPFFKLDRHTIKQGEYISLTEHDGVTRTFKIVSVIPLR